MKFINYLQSIAGVGIFPLISLMIFFLFFSAVAWYVWKADKAYIERARRIPVNDIDEDKAEDESQNHN